MAKYLKSVHTRQSYSLDGTNWPRCTDRHTYWMCSFNMQPLAKKNNLKILEKLRIPDILIVDKGCLDFKSVGFLLIETNSKEEYLVAYTFTHDSFFLKPSAKIKQIDTLVQKQWKILSDRKHVIFIESVTFVLFALSSLSI